jgi:YVTN family beta-propeller protein
MYLKIMCIVLLLAVFTFSLSTPALFTDLTTIKYSSSSIAITTDGTTLLAVNPDSNSVSLIDTASQMAIAEIAVGIDPSSVAVAPDGSRGFVSNKGSNSLSVIDIPSRAVLTTLEVGDQPVGVAVSPDGRFIAVAEMGGDAVRLLDTGSVKIDSHAGIPAYTTKSLIPVTDRPYGLAFIPNIGSHSGLSLLVTHLLSGVVTLIAEHPFIKFLPFIALQYPANNIPSPHIEGLKQTNNHWSLITEITTWPNVAPAPAVIVNAGGTRAYLPQTMANGQGYNTSFDTTVFPKVSVLNLETNQHQTSEHISLPESDRPVGLPWDAALSKNDTELWVINSASNDISVIDISNPGHPARKAHILVGDNPRGIVIAPDGATAYINNTLSGTVSVIDTTAYTITKVIPTSEIPLPPALLNGKRLFFSSARPDLAKAGWISCNTCHVEGEADGRTWLLQYLGGVPPGENPVIRRNTTSLRGMIETYPLRWSAEWNESADSEFSVRFEQFGTGLIDGEMNDTRNGPPNQGRSYDLDCLALYIDSLSPPARTHTLTEAEQRGRAIFESPQTQCTKCHPAPLYTDLQTHDVGTADGPGEWFGPLIDTPTLRFLYDSAPYLHNGSAATLWDVLVTKNPNDEHGVISQLTTPQINDLIAFLLALPY